MNYSENMVNKSLLAVDDESDVLEFLSLYLGTLGWTVHTAGSVADALKMLDEQNYFLVLTDIAMPDMDGYEFVSTIKERGISSKVVLMTGFGYNPNHTLIKLNKAVQYPTLFKPFDNAKLAATVQCMWQAYNGV